MGAQRNTSSEPQSGETINREDTLDENGVAWDIRFTFLLRPSGAFRFIVAVTPRLAPWATIFRCFAALSSRQIVWYPVTALCDPADGC
jgi:hypothetical protein